MGRFRLPPNRCLTWMPPTCPFPPVRCSVETRPQRRSEAPPRWRPGTPRLPSEHRTGAVGGPHGARGGNARAFSRTSWVPWEHRTDAMGPPDGSLPAPHGPCGSTTRVLSITARAPWEHRSCECREGADPTCRTVVLPRCSRNRGDTASPLPGRPCVGEDPCHASHNARPRGAGGETGTWLTLTCDWRQKGARNPSKRWRSRDV